MGNADPLFVLVVHQLRWKAHFVSMQFPKGKYLEGEQQISQLD